MLHTQQPCHSAFYPVWRMDGVCRVFFFSDSKYSHRIPVGGEYSVNIVDEFLSSTCGSKSLNTAEKQVQRTSPSKESYWITELGKLRKELDGIAKSDDSAPDFLLIYISSHGNLNKLYLTHEDDSPYITITEILDKFKEKTCQRFENKPKIFIFQCCLGNKIMSHTKIAQGSTATKTEAPEIYTEDPQVERVRQSMENLSVEGASPMSSMNSQSRDEPRSMQREFNERLENLGNNMFILYSTTPGHKSHYNECSSYFTDALKKVTAEWNGNTIDSMSPQELVVYLNKYHNVNNPLYPNCAMGISTLTENRKIFTKHLPTG